MGFWLDATLFERFMGPIKKLWIYVLLKNPSGLTCLIVIWGLGGIYWLASVFGVVERVDDWIMFKVLVSCGLFAFFFFPIWNLLVRKDF